MDDGERVDKAAEAFLVVIHATVRNNGFAGPGVFLAGSDAERIVKFNDLRGLRLEKLLIGLATFVGRNDEGVNARWKMCFEETASFWL